jgi:thioredoxin-like negative regulator of GroEL
VRRSEPEKGLPLLEQARGLMPDDLDIQYHLAQALYALGERSQALKMLKSSIEQERQFEEKEQALALLEKIKLEVSQKVK